jgi:hypothetical protein
VVHQIAADGVVNAELEGHLELGADAVRAADQDRVGKLLQVQAEEAAEAANFTQDVLVERLARQHLDALLGAIALADVDACVGIGGGLCRGSGLARRFFCSACVQRPILNRWLAKSGWWRSATEP